MDLRLRPLRPADEPEALAAHAELAPERFQFLPEGGPDGSWERYLVHLDAVGRGEGLAPGRVASRSLYAEVDGALVGRCSVRPRLTPWLERYGGHIGYGVRPQYRRRGYATEILRQSLIVARADGIDPVLVTCDEDNVGSATVIERNGGVLEDVVDVPDGGPPKRRYWIA